MTEPIRLAADPGRPTWLLPCPGDPNSDEPEMHLVSRLLPDGNPPWRCPAHQRRHVRPSSSEGDWQPPRPVPVAYCIDHAADEPAELLVHIRRVDRPGLDVWRHRPTFTTEA